jgi:hypothetical protein
VPLALGIGVDSADIDGEGETGAGDTNRFVGVTDLLIEAGFAFAGCA